MKNDDRTICSDGKMRIEHVLDELYELVNQYDDGHLFDVEPERYIPRELMLAVCDAYDMIRIPLWAHLNRDLAPEDFQRGMDEIIAITKSDEDRRRMKRCPRCEHQYITRTENPVKCPVCQYRFR